MRGINIVAEAVGCTLGPRGKTVIIQQEGHSPLVTKDGVSVSKSIRLSDPIEGLGAELIKQAAERTNDVAGDGTTTATVLTQAMVNEGNKLLNNGYKPQQLCKGIDVAVDAIVARLKNEARPIASSDEIKQVATISANGDEKIGQLVSEAMNKVGHDGIVTVDDAKGMATSLEVVEGLQFDRGYLSPYFVTNTEKMNVVYDGCRVLVTDNKITGMAQLVPILEKVVQARQSLLIIAEDVEGEALQALVLNRVKANFPLIAVKAPGYGQHREELLNDLCTLTGATLVSSRTGLPMDKASLVNLGTVKRVVVDAKTTTLVADGSTSTQVKEHVDQLRNRLQDIANNVDDVIKLKARIAGLAAGVAVIRVGGATELEIIEKKHRVEDALHATRAAMEEGIVSGGGTALINAIEKVVCYPPNHPNDGADILQGINIVLKACRVPLRRIVENADGAPDVIFMQASNIPPTHGYDASTETFRDMFEAGIIDPVKVTRVALQHAASVAKTFLMLDAVVYNEQDKK